MEPRAILYHLAHAEGLPEDAIRAAQAQRDAVAPVLVDLVERYLADEARAHELEAGLVFVFHLLGEWRETSAYRPLARLLARPSDELSLLLGDAITETTHRVMAAVFDGDPAPLHRLIEDQQADEFVRSRMFDALVMLALAGRLDRHEVATYLRDSFASLRPHAECAVWAGWQGAVAALGLAELRSLVRKAFDRGLIGRQIMAFGDFQGDLDYALAHPEHPWRLSAPNEFALFGDTIEELSGWYAFSDEYLEHQALGDALAEPASNPFRGVGRNDPCPCGSGRKFKKCCLA